ncbi:MAG: hypothetical protein PHF56_15175 [Desulfuromonadaceae bacterium]|nr:hypothetical protein [Desulfuromonadaceae bacterium]
METTNFCKETAAFNKTALNTSFDALNTLSGQAVVATDLLLAAVPSFPEEGKKVVTTCIKENQKALDNLKKNLVNGLDLDFTAASAPVKSLEALESFYNDAFSQAAVIKNETKALVDAATGKLPKEAKTIVNFWNDSFNFGFDSFQNYVNNNFALAKKVATDIFAVAPAVQAKAAK